MIYCTISTWIQIPGSVYTSRFSGFISSGRRLPGDKVSITPIASGLVPVLSLFAERKRVGK